MFALEVQLLDAREEIELQRRQLGHLFGILERVHSRLFNEIHSTTH